MPRPVFDIEQYELRGLVPKVYTEKQKNRLAQTLSRANGQIDWTAQLLGFNGANYWGQPVPTADGEYGWTGLPETMNEKRQMQVGAFGVYNKHLPYEQWPAPFNRSEIRALGDAKISIFERDGETVIAPLNLKDLVDFVHDPVLYLGAAYEFNAKIDISVAGGGSISDFARVQKFYVLDAEWTRVFINQIPTQGFQIKIADSEAPALNVSVLEWSDFSDWNHSQVRRQFYGLWGNKGSSLSLDFAFDSLDLHGFDERNGLGRSTRDQTVTLDELLFSVGLKPTIWTPFNSEQFGFKFETCPTAYPQSVLDPETYALLDREVEFQNCLSDCNHSVVMTQVRGTINENCDFSQSEILTLDPSTDNLAIDPVVIDLEIDDGNCRRSPLIIPGIESIKFDINELDSCSKVAERCLEWTWDPTLNNGTLEDVYYLPENPGPWAIADDGEYGVTTQDINKPFTSQGASPCDYTSQWTGFDDGIYEEAREPDCPEEPCLTGDQFYCEDVDGNVFSFISELPIYNVYQDNGEIKLALPCSPMDGGAITSLADFPDYDNCDCEIECCEIDGLEIFSGSTIYTGPITVTGGVTPVDPNEPQSTLTYCVEAEDGQIFTRCEVDNCHYDFYTIDAFCTPADSSYYAAGRTPDYSGCDCDIECCDINGGVWAYGEEYYSSSEIITGGIYLVESAPSLFNGTVTACPLNPVRLNIFDMIGGGMFTMQPSMRNIRTPLRVWKSQVLTTTDTVPAQGTEFWNYLVADENRGPEPEASFRYYVRLPLEYERDGKEWNRAISVCNNQGYFSAIPEMPTAHQTPDEIRPILYAETYWRRDIKDFVTYYDEDYLVSTLREDTLNTQNDFEDSRVSFEEEDAIPYFYASVDSYDPFDLRAPRVDGSWRGSYYVNGANLTRTGYTEVDSTTANLLRLSPGQEPAYDKSPIELPTTAFPESALKAPIKNYSVSYAYFITDFSAADDPIFDPDNQHCWRPPTLACQEVDDIGTCASENYKTNTAYRLHHYGEVSDPILV